MSHIFEPFFTTKSTTHGTGLGLSTVYGIVELARGWIAVDSQPGLGTTFTLGFPLTTESARARTTAAEDSCGGARADETILLVEDEPAVRSFARRTLERQGYHVLEASSGEEAMGVAGLYAGHINLLLTDVLMPGISGARLAELLSVTRPETVTLFMSGYSDEVLSRAGVSHDQFLQKPFGPAVLLERVRATLS
jgi:CheY-like chemotaxis protein